MNENSFFTDKADKYIAQIEALKEKQAEKNQSQSFGNLIADKTNNLQK